MHNMHKLYIHTVYVELIAKYSIIKWFNHSTSDMLQGTHRNVDMCLQDSR